MPKTTTVTLKLDADDYRDLMKEVKGRAGGIMPDGDSNDVGAHVGEIVRDLWEYRTLYERKESFSPRAYRENNDRPGAK